MQPTRQVRLVPASVAERSSDEHDKRMDLTETAEIRKRHCGKEPPVARWHGPGDSPPPYGARSTTLVLRRDADCPSSFGGVCRLLEHEEGESMSSAILPGPVGVGHPPRRSRVPTVPSAVVALLLAFNTPFPISPTTPPSQP